LNSILSIPKIDSDKPIPEQIQQIRSYLFRFKDEMELILSNIDSDNVTKKFEEKMYDAFSRKFEGSDTMSQIIQTTSLIKMEVKGAVQMGEDKYSSFAITPEGIKIKSTGTFTVDSGNFSINDEGDVSINGHVNALSGSIGGYKIESGMIRTNQPSASKPGLALVSGVGPDAKSLAIGFTSASDFSDANFFVNGDGTLHATGAEIDGTIKANSKIGGNNGLEIVSTGLQVGGYNALVRGHDGNGDYLVVGDDTATARTIIAGGNVKIYGNFRLSEIEVSHSYIHAAGNIDLGYYNGLQFKSRLHVDSSGVEILETPVRWQKLDDILGDPDVQVLTD